MNVKIGESVKRLRSERGVTQERLAEYLGVSAQAVSRWESETCYPDLETLPGIASYFDVSIDSLMGYDASEREQNALIANVGELLAHGHREKALAEARRGLALYPKNYALAIMLAANLIDSKKGSPERDECIALCRRVLRDCASGDALGDILRLNAKNLLVITLTANGDRAGALEVAQTMPIFSQTREITIQFSLTGEDKINYSLSILPLMCVMLGSSFLNGMAYPETDKMKPLWEYSADDCLRDIALWDAMYAVADKLDGGAAKRGSLNYMFLHFIAARRMVESGDRSKALEYLRAAAACLPENGAEAFAGINANVLEQVINKDSACAKRDDNYKDKNSAFVLYHGYIANGCFASLESVPGYAEIAAEIRAAAEK